MKRLGRIATGLALVAVALAHVAGATGLDTLIATNGTVVQGNLVFSDFSANIFGAGIGPSNVDVSGIVTGSGTAGLRFRGVPAGTFSQSVGAGGGGGAREIVIDVSFTVTVSGASLRIHGVQQALDPATAVHGNAVLNDITTIPPSGTPVASLFACVAGTGLPSGSNCSAPVDAKVLNTDTASLIVDRQIQIVVGQRGGAAAGDASTAYFDSTFTLVSTPCPGITVSPARLGDGIAAASYPAVLFSASGGATPYTFSVSGAVPAGMTFSAAAATLAGTPVLAGTYPLTVTASDANGCTGSRSYQFTVQDSSATPPPSASDDELVPVVVKLGGVGYSSELAVANTGVAPLELSLKYTSALAGSTGGTGQGLATAGIPLVVGAGEQLLLPDVLAWLRDRGAAGGADEVGSLHVSAVAPASPGSLRVSARTTSPSGPGRAGVGYGASATTDLTSASAAVYGLRQAGSDRSNLAIVNAGTSGATYRVTLVSGDPSDPRQVVLAPDLDLAPGEWRQLDRVLSAAGMQNGAATVERVAGSSPFVAYGVINDAGTNDGSFVTMAPPGGWAEPLVIPAVVETALFSTELTLANPGDALVVATMTYVESLTGAGTGPVRAALFLAPGEQRVVPEVIDFLRNEAGGIGPRGESHAGSLTVTFSASSAATAGWAGARVTTPGDGGRYGVAYSGLPLSAAASTEALVTGLRQDDGTRSNLALVNAGDTREPLVLKYEVWDGATGARAGESAPITLVPGEWSQVNRVLETFGVSNGWIRVLKISGPGRFIAYGVVNDGGALVPGTNDGSYVAMSGVK